MNKEMLQKVFREFKKVSGVRYAITNPDSLGDCMSCVNSALADKYGVDSLGVWVKHWSRGMNSWRGSTLEREKSVYIVHDLNEETARVFYDVFRKYYHVFPEKYDPALCFELFEKETPIWVVSYDIDRGNGTSFRAEDRYTEKDEAESRYHNLVEGGSKKVTLVKVF